MISFVCTGDWNIVSSRVRADKSWGDFQTLQVNLHDVSQRVSETPSAYTVMQAQAGPDYNQSVYITYQKLLPQDAQPFDATRNYIIKAEGQADAANFDILGMHLNTHMMIVLRSKDQSSDQMPDDIKAFIDQNNLQPVDADLVVQQFKDRQVSKMLRAASRVQRNMPSLVKPVAKQPEPAKPQPDNKPLKNILQRIRLFQS